MSAVIAIFFPALVLVVIRNYFLGNKEKVNLKKMVFGYPAAVVVLNLFMWGILYYVFENQGNLLEELNSYRGFAFKYLGMSLILAVVIPFFEKYINTRKIYEFKYWRIVILVYAVVVFGLSFIRIFENNFWGDEGYTIKLAKMSISEMLAATAGDVHPPLYYLIVQVFCRIFGFHHIVYHVVSLIPYVLILILCLTVIWKWFGKEAAAIMITFSSFLTSAIGNTLDVRMYSWAELFVLLSFLCLYSILHDDHVKSYAAFGIASLAAAYTHYYSLISVAFFYVVLILVAVFKERRKIKRVALTCVLTVIGYMPWLFVLLRTFQRTAGDYWMTDIPTWKESLYYLFCSKHEATLTIVFFMLLVFYLLRESGIIKFSDKSAVRSEVAVAEIIWVLAGIFSILGTIGVGIGVSTVVRPMFLVKYLFPVSSAAWLILGICVSKLKLKHPAALCLIALVLLSGIPEYYSTYTSEKKADEILEETLNTLSAQMQDGDEILTDEDHIDWTISEIYYPETKHQMLSEATYGRLNKNVTYWAVLEYGMDDEIETAFANAGFSIRLVVDEGKFGTRTVQIYKVYADKRTDILN